MIQSLDFSILDHSILNKMFVLEFSGVDIMNRNGLLIFILLFIFASNCEIQPKIELSNAMGHLFIIGGGSRPDDMMKNLQT